MRIGPFCVAIVALAFAGCGKTPEGDEFGFVVEEREHDEKYADQPIDLEGSVLDETGEPLAGVTARLIGWGDATDNHEASSTTGEDGRFVIGGLRRRSVLVRLSKEGYYDEIIPANLQLRLETSSAQLAPLELVERRPGYARFLFGGDSMFGRRFVDRNEDGVTDEPEDLIHSGSRGEDAKALLRFLRPLLASADYTQVNLESPVSRDPAEVHPYKEFKFHSHPETLVALPYAGVDGVSLGNNHVYDLLESGMVETLDSVTDAGLDWFGAGMSETEAREFWYAGSSNGVEFAMQGFNGIIPFNFPPWGPDPWDDAYLYNAMDTPIVKGGSLGLSNENVDDFLARVPDERFRIPVLHGGFEYGEYPSKNMRAQMARAIAGGAGVVVAHHPHTLYGVAVLGGHDPPAVALMSLGNLVFDQDVFETFQSVVAVVDVEQRPEGGHVVRRIRLVPFHIEGYVPKMIAGAWAERVGRHVGHISTYLPPAAKEGDAPDGLRGAVVFPTENRIAVCVDASEYETTDSVRTYDVELDEEEVFGEGTSGPLPYRRLSGADALARVETLEPATCEIGRELMHYGDFEDLDVDDAFHEGHLWNQSGFRFVENSRVRNGLGGLVLLRRQSSEGFVSTWLKNRVTFAAGHRLTVTGYLRGREAGDVEIQVRWFVRDEREVISTTTEYMRPAGTYGWERFVIDLEPPSEAGTIRVFFRQHPPGSGEGELFIDDVAIVQWEESGDAHEGIDLSTPNNFSWLRFRSTDPAAVSAGSLGVRLTHREFSLRRSSAKSTTEPNR